MEDKETYTGLTKSLDSLRDIILAEVRLIETEEEKTEFADFATKRVKAWIKEIAEKRRDEWRKMNSIHSKKFQNHAELLLSNPSEACPPGFIEIDGICVPI